MFNNYSTGRKSRLNTTGFVTAGLMIFGAIGSGFSQENTLPDNGNVGIGTTEPTARLQVGGSAKIDSSLVVSDTLHVENKLSVGGDAKVGQDLKVDGNLILENLEYPDDYNDVEPLFADPDGIVKKGTYDQLKSLIYAPPVKVDPNDPKLICFETYTDHPTWLNGVKKIYVPCPDVRVGIGTASPEYQLDVTNDSRFGTHAWFRTTASVGGPNGGFAQFSVTNKTAAAGLSVSSVGNNNQYNKLLYMEYDNLTTEAINVRNTTQNYSSFLLNTTGDLKIANDQGYTTFHLDETGGLALYNGAQATLRVEPSGRLSLYSNGQQTFRVETNGFIRGRRLRLDTETWADYVFEPTYHLMPLKEVEKFIYTEKHLPNVPSEQELLEKGTDVMEMNRVLMEKVEELTLYLIEQNNKLTELQKQIETLKAKTATDSNK